MRTDEKDSTPLSTGEHLAVAVMREWYNRPNNLYRKEPASLELARALLSDGHLAWRGDRVVREEDGQGTPQK